MLPASRLLARSSHLAASLLVIASASFLISCLPRADAPSGTGSQPGATAAPPQAPASAMSAPSQGLPAPAAVSGQAITIEINPEGSEARYRAQEVLARIRIPSEAVGRARPVSGAIAFDAAGKVIPAESKITVDLRMLQSDQGLRDRFVRSDVLQTNRFPNAEFVVQEVRGLPWPPPESGELSFELIGDLTVHGVTRSVTWQAKASVSGREITGTATTRAKITDFGMPIPRVPTVLSLEDELTLELGIKATRS